MRFNRDTFKRLHNGCIAALVLAILFVWADIWTDLRSYEMYTPEELITGFCSELVTESRSGSCEKLLKSYGYSNSVIPVADSGKYLSAAVRDADIRYTASSEEEGVYFISADDRELIKVAITRTGSSGILDLPDFGITSVKGLVTADYVVTHPDAVKIGGVELTSLSPTQTGYVLDDFQDLHRALPELKVPDHYVYSFSNLFRELPAADAQGPLETLKTSEGKIYVVENVVEPDEKIRAIIEDYNRSYLYFLSGDVQWDSFKGNVLSTSPLYMRVQPREGELFARQISSRVDDFTITECCSWTKRMMSVEVSCTYVIQSPDGIISFPVDNIYYLYYCDDSRWRICELYELSAVPVIGPEQEAQSNE